MYGSLLLPARRSARQQAAVGSHLQDVQLQSDMAEVTRLLCGHGAMPAPSAPPHVASQQAPSAPAMRQTPPSGTASTPPRNAAEVVDLTAEGDQAGVGKRGGDEGPPSPSSSPLPQALLQTAPRAPSDSLRRAPFRQPTLDRFVSPVKQQPQSQPPHSQPAGAAQSLLSDLPAAIGLGTPPPPPLLPNMVSSVWQPRQPVREGGRQAALPLAQPPGRNRLPPQPHQQSRPPRPGRAAAPFFQAHRPAASTWLQSAGSLPQPPPQRETSPSPLPDSLWPDAAQWPGRCA